MKQVLISQGRAVVEEVPAPKVDRGMLLVKTEYSCISVGTEMSGIRMNGAPLWKRALSNPDKVARVVKQGITQGIRSAGRTVSNVVSASAAGTPTGYSAAGLVLEVGEGVTGFRGGDRVACAGAQFAHHAEIICVPPNLTVPVPEGLELRYASTVTLGAIAMQGVRRAQPTLGETFVVIGLGILGQLTAQLLRTCGCRVIGTDLRQSRIDLAHKLGMDLGLQPDGTGMIEHVKRLTSGVGADGVIITASSPSNKVLANAFQMCRKKGRVVLVGDVGLNLNRDDIYAKELDFFISTSYGPGRYDRRYEEEGLDYPVAYVRWTENRNMSEYVRLLTEGKLVIEPLIDAVYDLDHAYNAYATLQDPDKAPLMVLLSYPRAVEGISSRMIPNPTIIRGRDSTVQLALVGAGAFATSTHLPNLQKLAGRFSLRAVVSRTGHHAYAASRRFGIAYATTDLSEVLSDPQIDALLIVTRHDLHAKTAIAALKAGKHVFVEKPLALTQAEIDEIAQFFSANEEKGNQSPILMTGFNRRFSPHAQLVHKIVGPRTNPMIINYRMNAGYIPLDHWVHGAEGGGRNIGEACHIYDLFTYLTDSECKHVDVRHITPVLDYYSPSDNFVAVLTFSDGSVASLTYTALGTTEYPKERMEVFADGKVISLDDYRAVSVLGSGKPVGLKTKSQEKGHLEALTLFGKAIQQGEDWPIPMWQQIQATEIALKVEQLLMSTT